jgi:chromosomal replication initiation ATPase DnaA
MGRPLFQWPRPTPKPEAKREPRPKKRLGLGPRYKADSRAQQVVAAFCKAFEVEEEGVMSASHARIFARPRQASMYFLYTEVEMSSPQIGRLFDRDHSTVVHGRRAVGALLLTDPDFSARYHRAVRALRAIWSNQ